MTKTFVSRHNLNRVCLIATVSSFALAGSAFAASQATWEFYRSLAPGQQWEGAPELPAACFDSSGNLAITPDNVELCSALPTAAVGPDLTPPDTEGGTDRRVGDDDSFGDDTIGDDTPDDDIPDDDTPDDDTPDDDTPDDDTPDDDTPDDDSDDDDNQGRGGPQGNNGKGNEGGDGVPGNSDHSDSDR